MRLRWRRSIQSTFLRSAVFFVFAVSLGSASAGTINLSSGTMDFRLGLFSEIHARAHLAGDRGFTADGVAGAPINICNSEFCAPGDTIDVGTGFGGIFEAPAQATLDGLSYTDIGSFSGRRGSWSWCGSRAVAAAPEFDPATLRSEVTIRSKLRRTQTIFRRGNPGIDRKRGALSSPGSAWFGADSGASEPELLKRAPLTTFGTPEH